MAEYFQIPEVGTSTMHRQHGSSFCRNFWCTDGMASVTGRYAC